MKSEIESKFLMINLRNPITIGDSGIRMDVIHQISLFENNNGEMGCDVEFVDIQNVKFLGIPIGNTYNDFKNFKNKIQELGIDIDQLIDNECEGIISSDQIIKLKLKYKDVILNKDI